MIATGGGDCPGLNAVIRSIVKAAKIDGNWEVWGSIEAFNGVLKSPHEVVKLNRKRTAGIHVKGGTIIKTTNKGNPMAFPVLQEDGTWKNTDRSDELIGNIRNLGFDAVVNVGGDGSQMISLALFEKGLNIVGVPKTIDNDLSCTDLTFGFTTAVQIATDSFDKLVTTAESHHRVMIMEVMGRDAGWIALHTAIAGGAEVCLIPEIPFSIMTIMQKIERRYRKNKGFVNIVIAEGAKPVDGHVMGHAAKDAGDPHIKLGGIGNYLRCLLEENGCPAQVRTTILGHVQRGGTPMAFDRILATAMGEKAFQLIKNGEFGKMVTFTNNKIDSVKISDAVREPNFLHSDHYLIKMAKNIGISFGD